MTSNENKLWKYQEFYDEVEQKVTLSMYTSKQETFNVAFECFDCKALCMVKLLTTDLQEAQKAKTFARPTGWICFTLGDEITRYKLSLCPLFQCEICSGTLAQAKIDVIVAEMDRQNLKWLKAKILDVQQTCFNRK